MDTLSNILVCISIAVTMAQLTLWKYNEELEDTVVKFICNIYKLYKRIKK